MVAGEGQEMEDSCFFHGHYDSSPSKAIKLEKYASFFSQRILTSAEHPRAPGSYRPHIPLPFMLFFKKNVTLGLRKTWDS